MSSSPLVFAKLTRFVLESLRQQGIRLTNYLDNTCVLGWTQQECLSSITSRTSGIHYQQTENESHTNTYSGISRLRIQYHQHEDQSSHKKDEQSNIPNQTAEERCQTIQLPMDSGTHWQDDSLGPSNWKCTVQLTISPEEFSTQSPTTRVQLGERLFPVTKSDARLTLVGKHSNTQECAPPTTDTKTTRRHHNLL